MAVLALGGCQLIERLPRQPAASGQQEAVPAAEAPASPEVLPSAEAEPAVIAPVAPAEPESPAEPAPPTEAASASAEMPAAPAEEPTAKPVEETAQEQLPPADEDASTEIVYEDQTIETDRVVDLDVSYPIGIIGAVEPVYIEGHEAPFHARIDTGATTSSIDADNIRYFERDGRRWVRFDIRHRESDEVLTLETRVRRQVAIKRQEGESEERFVVRLTIRMGGVTMKRDFSLANRSEFDYSILIGRNVLRGMAIVDVAQRNILDDAPTK